MALYKTITADAKTHIYIWEIKETLEELSKGLKLTPFCAKRLKTIKSDQQKKQLLSIRHLLKIAGHQDTDIHYDMLGKPHLRGDEYISMTHSHHFSGIIVSAIPVGIDIEKKREKILKIAPKFTPLEEYRTLANTEALIRKLTLVWCAKEAIYKVMEIRGLSFLEDIYIEDFDFDEEISLSAEVNYNGKRTSFKLNFSEFQDFACVYAYPINTAVKKPLYKI